MNSQEIFDYVEDLEKEVGSLRWALDVTKGSLKTSQQKLEEKSKEFNQQYEYNQELIAQINQCNLDNVDLEEKISKLIETSKAEVKGLLSIIDQKEKEKTCLSNMLLETNPLLFPCLLLFFYSFVATLVLSFGR